MENNLDKLFKSKLGGQEPGFHPAAWDRMEGFLNDEGMIPIEKKKPNRRIIIYLSILFIGILISMIGYWTLKSNYAEGEGSTLVNSVKSNPQNTTDVNNSDVNNNDVNKTIPSTENTISNTSSIFNTDHENTLTDKTKKQNLESNSYSNNISKKKKTMVSLDNVLESESKTSTQIQSKNINESLLSKYIKSNSIAQENEVFENHQNQNNDQVFVEDSSEKAPIDNKVGNDQEFVKTVESYNDSKHDVENPIEETLKELKALEIRQPLALLDLLEIQNGILKISDKIIIPQVQKLKPSAFEVGLQASSRFRDGVGYSVGPYVSYAIGNGFAFGLAGQFDSQNFGDGPELSVLDKVYSFGSKVNERKFNLNNQKSIRIPFSVRKSFYRFELVGGVVYNRVLASEGEIVNSGEVKIEKSIIIDNDMIMPSTVSFQFGVSVGLNRYFDMDIGVEYRPKTFATDPTTSNNNDNLYPSLGLKYKLFKF